MELKFDGMIDSMLGVECFNRTLMELKFETAAQQILLQAVLIVPLWN